MDGSGVQGPCLSMNSSAALGSVGHASRGGKMDGFSVRGPCLSMSSSVALGLVYPASEVLGGS